MQNTIKNFSLNAILDNIGQLCDFFYETNICLVYICKEDEQILGNGNVYSYLKLKQ